MHWTAYFDESGTHDSSIVILAGVIAPSEQWAAFDAEWAAMLARHQVPYVHCSEATHSKGAYAGWSKDRCDQMMYSASALIVKHIPVTVTAIMRKDVHNEVFHDQRSKGIGVRQLAILFRASMGFFIDIVENHGAERFERMDFVYEHGQKEGPLRAPFNRFKELPEYDDKLGTLRFAKRTDPDALGLQAADKSAVFSCVA